MKLLTKLTLFITGSKVLIVLLFVVLLPALINRVGFQYTNYYLAQQKNKVLAVIRSNGFDYYLQGDSTYGSYTLLKEEYISLYPSQNPNSADTIETSRRIVENDTLDYRVLTHHMLNGKRPYILEIGKTTATIGQFNKLLQRFALYVLICLIAVSILIDLIYTNVLLSPLSEIVRTKLVGRKFPFKESLVAVNTSTSDFKHLDTALIDLMEKVHEAFEKEREFTSNASHELLTPVTILQNNIENLMMDESLGESQQQRISAMLKTLARLKKIILSLLYISRIDNAQFAKTDVVNLTSIASEVLEELCHRIESKGLTCRNEIAPDASLTCVNRDLLFQLLFNLVNNAVRYNKENGAIFLRGGNNPYGCYLEVEDTGIGIAEEDLPLIFNRFRRSGHRGEEGYGLGLSIVKSIIDYHEASVEVSSKPGIGTTFTIRFYHSGRSFVK